MNTAYRLPLLLYVFALLALVSSASYVALTNYAQATKTASSRSAARADLAAELVANKLLSTQYGLRTLAGFLEPLIYQADILPGTGLESLEQLLNEELSRQEFVDELFVTDLGGNVIHASSVSDAGRIPGWSFLKRRVEESPEDDLITPLYTDPESGETWIWGMRKLRSGTGDFVAVIAAPQSPAVIADALAGLSLSEGQSIAIIDESLRLVARLPDGTKAAELQGSPVDELYTRRFAESGSSSEQAVFESPIDGERRFYAFQRVQNAPYIVVVGERTSVALQGWRHSLVASAVGILLVAIIGLFFLKQFYRRVSVEKELILENQERKSLQYAAQANEAELRIASTAFDTHLGIMITDDNGLILRANRAFSRITGYDEQEVVGMSPRILQSGLQDAEFYSHLWARVGETGTWEGEIWNRRKNGDVFAEWLTITAIYGASGAVQNYVGTFHDITKRKEAEREAHRLAFYDSLTGLANRALLEERISDVCKLNTRQGTHAALLYLDIEQFRAVNDARGYGTGDLVLKSLAAQLGPIVRESDTLARIGGDEFAVLLANLHSSQEIAARSAETVADKILQAFSRPIAVLGYRIQVGVSIGITLIDGRDTPCDQQVQRAEQATQQAKERARLRGEKRIAFFNPDIQEKIVQHVLLEEELRNALAREQLAVFFQPQIRDPDHLLGYEVLLRWRHPERGMVSPAVFIPIAEQSRLILPIGRWVLEQACKRLAAWQKDAARSGLSLAVNVSVVQFQSDDFIAQLEQILEQTGAPPHLLKLEVTESLLLEDPERITEIMRHLRALGIRFSLDDFGTGYSSMSYLKGLPLDQIKIDQSFVNDVTTNLASSAIVESIIGLARGLGLEVIAEGVETEEQRKWLVKHGCIHFQGYLFGRPGEEV
ncbi:bifunctional diguanylate cyclase/phosphodiesterase [Marinobacter vulgaris]|uniref:bifunctional diguanylate cyclase/phosphodiesterase n=1 Tax=Marinobacter vulgaris TaxID=1928331 RepID=UPI001D0D8EAD|nr:EAL domain-containing protein [Marinobacter vulgaris]